MNLKQLKSQIIAEEIGISDDFKLAIPELIRSNPDFAEIVELVYAALPFFFEKKLDIQVDQDLNSFIDKIISIFDNVNKIDKNKLGNVIESKSKDVFEYLKILKEITTNSKNLTVASKEAKKSNEDINSFDEMFKINKNILDLIKNLGDINNKMMMRVDNRFIKRKQEKFDIINQIINCIEQKLTKIQLIVQPFKFLLSLNDEDKEFLESFKESNEAPIDEESLKRKEILDKLRNSINLANTEYLKLKKLYSSISNNGFKINDKLISGTIQTFGIMIQELEKEYNLPINTKGDAIVVDQAVIDINNVKQYITSQINVIINSMNESSLDIKDIFREEVSLLVRKDFEDIKDKHQNYETMAEEIAVKEEYNPSDIEKLMKAYSMIASMYEDIEKVKLGSYVIDIGRFSK